MKNFYEMKKNFFELRRGLIALQRSINARDKLLIQELVRKRYLNLQRIYQLCNEDEKKQQP